MTYAIGKNLPTCEAPLCGQPVTSSIKWENNEEFYCDECKEKTIEQARRRAD